MNNENEIEFALKGKERQTLWGYENPEFNESKNGVLLDAFVTEESVVPYRYSEGKTFWLKDKGSTRLCMNYVFRLIGHISRQDDQMKLVGAFTHALPHDWEKHHVAFRALGDEVYSKGAVRTFIYRVYENTDECSEHPEMLSGTPCGMYHCPVCMEMVIAGVPHPSKEHIREYHESLNEKIPAGFEPVNEMLADGVKPDVLIATGKYSDVPVTISDAPIVIMGTDWAPTSDEQVQSRLKRDKLAFRTRAEQEERKATKDVDK